MTLYLWYVGVLRSCGLALKWVQLEIDQHESAGVFQRMTLTYGLGDQHGLYEDMKIALA